jgi:hypothetical protein
MNRACTYTARPTQVKFQVQSQNIRHYEMHVNNAMCEFIFSRIVCIRLGQVRMSFVNVRKAFGRFRQRSGLLGLPIINIASTVVTWIPHNVEWIIWSLPCCTQLLSCLPLTEIRHKNGLFAVEKFNISMENNTTRSSAICGMASALAHVTWM